MNILSHNINKTTIYTSAWSYINTNQDNFTLYLNYITIFLEKNSLESKLMNLKKSALIKSFITAITLFNTSVFAIDMSQTRNQKK